VKGGDARDAIAIALLIDDPLLADRLVAVLGDVPGVRLVPRGEPADVVLVSTGNSANAASADDAAMTDTAPDALDASPSTDALLTPREREVLALLAEGASNKAIARTLGISVHTAKFHVGSLLDKLDATGRTDAVTHAARRGVIDL
jgi:DNA-binding CsgD family transcriptional regulator